MRCWLWLALLTLSLPPSAALADSWAVLVGIADYTTPDWRLQSPPNDLSLMLDLCGRWGIPSGHKMVLRDGAATKQAVLDTKLLLDAAPALEIAAHAAPKIIMSALSFAHPHYKMLPKP